MAETTETRCRLCLVTPTDTDAGAFAPRLSEAVAAGDVATLIVAARRDDDAAWLAAMAAACTPVAQAHGVAVVIAGSPDIAIPIAKSAGADGVQLDVWAGIATARAALGGDCIVGLGGLDGRHAAMLAGETDTDYLFFGRFDDDDEALVHDAALALADWWADVAVVPAIVMGGASLESVDQARDAGVEFVALGRAVWDDPRGPAAAVADANARLAEREVAA